MGNFLSSLLGSGSKEQVYLSVTPGVGLELCRVDNGTKQVKAYTFRELAYNETAKDIADYEAFKNCIEDMFAELQIKPNCNVVVNMPLCSLGTMNFPLISGDDAITMGVTSEVEQSYIFRRLEPVVAWSDINVASNNNTDTRKILYSAIQKTVIENISAALTSLGATLSGIEVSAISYLRALDYIGYTPTQMQDNITWNLMIVNSTGYYLLSMVGKNIVDYYEEPLAIKTFEGDDIYNAINASAQITLMSYPANYLYIISETDMVSAELLSKKIQNAGTIDFFENNTFKKHEVMAVSLEVLPDNILKISLQAVGCAVSDVANYPVNFDFVKDSVKGNSGDIPIELPFGDPPIVITPTEATKVSAVICIVVCALLGGISFLILPNLENSKVTQVNEISEKITAIDKQLEAAQVELNATGAFNVAKQVDFVLKNNRFKLMNYSSIGSSIPDNVWLTSFHTSANGLIMVTGESTNVEDVYAFFNNMKDSLIHTKLRLHKLQMKTGTVDDLLSSNDDVSTYEFEITNMDSNQINVLLGLKNEDVNGENNNENNIIKNNNINNIINKNNNNNNNNNNNVQSQSSSQSNNNNTPVPENKLLSDAPLQMD